MKRLVAIGMSAVLGLLLFAGCGASEEQQSGGDSGTDKKKLVVWGPIPAENGPQEVCDTFMETNPDIEIEYVRYVNDDQGNVKLDTALMSGEQIDVYFTQFEDYYVKRIESGMAEDLEPWLEEDGFDIQEAYGDGVWQYEGKTYGLPTNYDHQFVWVNQTMFEEAGIEIPESWTWEEYADITKQLTKEENGVQIYGGFMKWQDVGRLMGRGQVLGADSFYKSDTESNFDDPVYRETLELFERLMITDKSHMDFVEATNSKLEPYGEFLSGKVATCISSPWIARYINDLEQYPHDFKTVAVPLPQWEDSEHNYGWPGLTGVIMMNPASENKEAAYEFIKYFGTEGQEYMCSAGKIPSWTGIEPDVALQEMLGENAEELFDVESFESVIFNDSIERYYNTKFNKLPELERVWKEEVEKFVTEEQDLETTLQNAKERGDSELQ